MWELKTSWKLCLPKNKNIWIFDTMCNVYNKIIQKKEMRKIFWKFDSSQVK